jgi:hypothetical protein
MASVAVDQREFPVEARNALETGNMKWLQPLSAWDVAYSVNMAIARLISYWVMTNALSGLVGSDTDYLGGMWATVATVFVFRDTRKASVSAGAERFVATCVS